MLEINIYQNEKGKGLPIPQYMSSGAAGVDLPAAVKDKIVINPGEFRLVPTGIHIEIPSGFEGQVRPRSGLAAKFGITVLNSPGTIDSDYRGEIKVVLINNGKNPFVITRGDRIAQLVISKVERVNFVPVVSLKQTGRNESGFGHTGI